jgi:V-type H+-transporting ATPase subunit a
MDPIWSLTNNKLTFVNSVKMKMSVIFGIFHMTLGILIKGTNTLYFGQIIKFMTEVIAGLFILLGLFGWMDALIISKFFKIPNLDECSPTYEPLGENKN